MTSWVRGIAVVLGLASMACGWPVVEGGESGGDKGGTAVSKQDWKDVERLVSEQKLAEAKERVGAIREAAMAAGQDEDWARALIEEVQLGLGLHGYETTVRSLKERPWPTEPRARAIVELIYAHSLMRYLGIYSWEIGQRERVETGGALDLKAWTREQVVEAANAAYAAVWAERGKWGDESLGSLARFFEVGTYPAEIRGTLRDTVSYLWVELLADTSHWRSEHSDEVYRLDLGALLADGAPAPAGLDLVAGTSHPLSKIVAILGDLEAWHGRAGRSEAAFEARLERLRQLSTSFSRPEDRERLRRDLVARLGKLGSSRPWWSMGQAELAELVRMEERPQALVDALALAREGQAKHPGSVGGRRCAAIAAGIAAPAYELQAMATDGPGRRSIEITHKNVERLYFRAYAVDLLRRVASARDYNLLPAWQEVEELLTSRRPAVSFDAALPPTPDHRLHRTFVVPPPQLAAQPGLYVIIASAREDFAEGRNLRVAVNFVVSEMALASQLVGEVVEATALVGATGAPATGAEIDLYRFDWQNGHRKVASKLVDGDGRASFAVAPARRESYFLLARRGADVTIDPDQLQVWERGRPSAGMASLVYTDRSVYRPGQRLLFKVVAYSRDAEGSRFEVAAGARLQVVLRDPNGQTVAEQALETNSFGSASGEIVVPTGRLLGQWQLSSSLGGGATILVEEYKRPTFEVTVKDPEAALRLNRPATLRGEARYYFGLPVAAGEVSWRITREPVYPLWCWWWRPAPTSEQILAAGKTALAEDGSFSVTFTPEADEREAAVAGKGPGAPPPPTYRFRLSAEVVDEGGETRSASRAFRLGFVAVETFLDLEAGFLRAGEPGEVVARRVDLDGAPRAGEGSWKLVKVVQPAQPALPAEVPADLPPGQVGEGWYHTAGDLLRPRWEQSFDAPRVMSGWQDGAEVANGSLRHDATGHARLALPALPAGVYRLRYTTTDDFGARFESFRDLVVTDPKGTRLALPLHLGLERAAVPVGQTARLFVASGFADQPIVLEIWQGDRRRERRTLRAGSDAQIVELPIREQDRGGFTVLVSTLRDFQPLVVRQPIFVPWDDKELKVSFETFRDRLRPGQKERWTVRLEAADGKALGAGAAELLAYMYDRSLEVFAPHAPANALDLYPDRQSSPWQRTNLRAAGPVWSTSDGFGTVPDYQAPEPDRLKVFDSYGIGGPGRGGRLMRMAAPESMAMAAAPPSPETPKVVSQDSARQVADRSEEVSTSMNEAGGEGAPPPASDGLRSNFSETAFWFPHLVIGAGGAVSFEFEVPDSVTEWNVWVNALTRDLRSGQRLERTKTVKELLVRPYLPRFLREGDAAVIKVVVQNAGDAALSGKLDFAVEDPATGEDLTAELGLARAQVAGVPFLVGVGKSVDLAFPIAVPKRVGSVAFRVTGEAGAFRDGELRALPILPGRVHLAQSRFAALGDEARRELRFADMAAEDDPSRIDEQLVVTLDAQLFYGVLDALPYLVDYPYECTEQTLNRFLASGLVATLYERYPAVASMAKQLSTRETALERWDQADPNRRMALEETPWLRQAQGGKTDHDLVNVLDPRRAEAERKASLAKLEKAQTASGGFPWWPGGPPSPYMTLYLVAGFSRALEAGVEVPQPVVQRAWSYLHQHYLTTLVREMRDKDCCWEMVTLLGFVLTSYPDEAWTGGVFTAEERRQMLEHSFRNWKRHSPLLKAFLALTLHRSGRPQDAKLVFDSVMDSAKSDPDLGTFWAPEDRAWLWYNDRIETHAFALRALLELSPRDPRASGLVHWLFLNKKLNHWKSTRATAEVIYALVRYLDTQGTLAAREAATVTVGPIRKDFVFEPDRYTGKKNQVVVEGAEIDPATMSAVVVEKQSRGLMFASATWHFSTEKPPVEAAGDFLHVERRMFKRERVGKEWVLAPLAEGAKIAVGDQLEVQLSLRSKHALEYVHLKDPRGAGFEPETTTSRYQWNLGIGWYEEVRDSGTNFFFDWLPVGEYTFKYRLRAAFAGTFKVAPATVQPMYAPEFVAYSSGAEVVVR